MPFTREFIDLGNWVHVVTKGSVDSPDELVEKLRQGLEKIGEIGHKRAFVDDRGVKMNIDVYDLTVGAEMMSEQGFPLLGLRLACMCRPEDRELYRGVETVYRNRSMMYRVFDDEEEAISWLER
jgi:hypothetical protein